MTDIKTWILTFDRPHALNRLIETLGKQGTKCSVFSNHPKVQILNSNKEYVEDVVVNTLNSTHSNSWCARSWNSIMIRSMGSTATKLALIQDDTFVSPTYVSWLDEQSKKYDFMWGPGGDQWQYLTFDVLKNTGYWDERYIGCYCGDADYLRRVWMNNDHKRISVEEAHPWGFYHNESGIRQNVLTEMHIKMCDPNYENQHWQLEKGGNPTIKASDKHFFDKWGFTLGDGNPVINSALPKMIDEIDWYPWFTKIHGVKTGAFNAQN